MRPTRFRVQWRSIRGARADREALREFTRRAIGAACAVATLACGLATDTEVSNDRIGTYVLDSLDAFPLPAPAIWNGFPVTVVADTLLLLLLANERFTILTVTDPAPRLGLMGTVTYKADSVYLHDPLLGSLVAAGEFVGTRVRLTSLSAHALPGHDWRYRKLE